jgi:hypothetical protein
MLLVKPHKPPRLFLARLELWFGLKSLDHAPNKLFLVCLKPANGDYFPPSVDPTLRVALGLLPLRLRFPFTLPRVLKVAFHTRVNLNALQGLPMSVLENKRRSLCLVADRVRPRTLLDGLGSHASRTEKNMNTLFFVAAVVGFCLCILLLMFLDARSTRPQWQRTWGGPNNNMITTERHARANWWCPARRNRSVATGVAGFNLSIFPINMQWRHRLIAWLFPYYFWMTLDRHGRCLGSNCAVWRWHRDRRWHSSNDEGWCGLADEPHS